MDWRKPRSEAVPPTLSTLEGEAITTPAKALALYRAYFLTVVIDIGGGLVANVSNYPI